MVESVKATTTAATTRPSPASGRAAVRREQRRSMIITACEEQLAAAGLVGTTLASVGERVGLTKGALYYYVDGRDEMLALVLEDALEAIREDAQARTSPEATIVEELTAFAHAHVQAAVFRAAGPLIVSNVDHLANHAPAADLLHEHEMSVRRLIEAGLDRGDFRQMNPIVASTVFFGALNTLCRTYNVDGDLTLEEMTEQAVDLLFGSWRSDG